jgi:hypothetical protein
MNPITIRLPRLVGHLERFLRPAAASHGEGVEIRQDARGTTVVACEGRHGAVVRSKPGATTPLEMPSVLVDAAALALAGDHDLQIVLLSETTAVAPIPGGQPETITLRPGTLPESARSMADTVEGEIASGMTKAAFEIAPRHLLAVAEMLVATGAATATIAIAPRWNVLAAIVDTDELEATFTIAGEGYEQPAATAPAEDDPLEFTFGGGRKGGPRGRSSARPKPPEELSREFLDDLPF